MWTTPRAGQSRPPLARNLARISSRARRASSRIRRASSLAPAVLGLGLVGRAVIGRLVGVLAAELPGSRGEFLADAADSVPDVLGDLPGYIAERLGQFILEVGQVGDAGCGSPPGPCR